MIIIQNEEIEKMLFQFKNIIHSNKNNIEIKVNTNLQSIDEGFIKKTVQKLKDEHNIDCSFKNDYDKNTSFKQNLHEAMKKHRNIVKNKDKLIKKLEEESLERIAK